MPLSNMADMLEMIGVDEPTDFANRLRLAGALDACGIPSPGSLTAQAVEVVAQRQAEHPPTGNGQLDAMAAAVRSVFSMAGGYRLGAAAGTAAALDAGADRAKVCGAASRSAAELTGE